MTGRNNKGSPYWCLDLACVESLQSYATAEDLEAHIAKRHGKKRLRSMSDTILRAMFDKFDYDKSNGIDCSELTALFKDLKWPSDSTHVQKCLTYLDKSADGRIDFDEFCRFREFAYNDMVLGGTQNSAWATGVNRRKSFDKPNMLPPHHLDNFEEEEEEDEGRKRRSRRRSSIHATKHEILRATFDKFDYDRSGSIDVGELQALFEDLRWAHDSAAVERCLAFLDKSHDSQIQFDEFLNFQEFAFQDHILGGKNTWASELKVPSSRSRSVSPQPRASRPSLVDDVIFEDDDEHFRESITMSKDDILRQTFTRFDYDRSGTMESSELAALFDDLNWPSDEVQACLEYLDKDENSVIEFEEFKRFHEFAFQKQVLGGKSSPHTGKHYDFNQADARRSSVHDFQHHDLTVVSEDANKPSFRASITMSKNDILKATFDKFDYDRSGSIDANELEALFMDLGWDSDEASIATCLEFLDKSHTCSIRFDEFVNFHEYAYESKVLLNVPTPERRSRSNSCDLNTVTETLVEGSEGSSEDEI